MSREIRQIIRERSRMRKIIKSGTLRLNGKKLKPHTGPKMMKMKDGDRLYSGLRRI
jgi:ribosomal 50S subunit-recycling heat shock protein